MNKMLTGAIVIGTGVAAYRWAQKNDVLPARNMKQMKRKIKNALF